MSTSERVLKELYGWETTRSDYPAALAIHPAAWFELNSDFWHMCYYDVESGAKFRGIPVIQDISADRDYFEFMDEERVHECESQRKKA